MHHSPASSSAPQAPVQDGRAVHEQSADARHPELAAIVKKSVAVRGFAGRVDALGQPVAPLGIAVPY